MFIFCFSRPLPWLYARSSTQPSLDFVFSIIFVFYFQSVLHTGRVWELDDCLSFSLVPKVFCLLFRTDPCMHLLTYVYGLWGHGECGVSGVEKEICKFVFKFFPFSELHGTFQFPGSTLFGPPAKMLTLDLQYATVHSLSLCLHLSIGQQDKRSTRICPPHVYL